VSFGYSGLSYQFYIVYYEYESLSVKSIKATHRMVASDHAHRDGCTEESKPGDTVPEVGAAGLP
jgi:hypothetical protein